jgi:hypothetical protein
MIVNFRLVGKRFDGAPALSAAACAGEFFAFRIFSRCRNFLYKYENAYQEKRIGRLT